MESHHGTHHSISQHITSLKHHTSMTRSTSHHITSHATQPRQDMRQAHMHMHASWSIHYTHHLRVHVVDALVMTCHVPSMRHMFHALVLTHLFCCYCCCSCDAVIQGTSMTTDSLRDSYRDDITAQHISITARHIISYDMTQRDAAHDMT